MGECQVGVEADCKNKRWSNAIRKRFTLSDLEIEQEYTWYMAASLSAVECMRRSNLPTEALPGQEDCEEGGKCRVAANLLSRYN